MKSREKPRPVEAKWILENLDLETLQVFAAGENSEFFKVLDTYIKRYATTMSSEILDLQEYDWKRLAIDKARRTGKIAGLAVLVAVIKGATGELVRRKKD